MTFCFLHIYLIIFIFLNCVVSTLFGPPKIERPVMVISSMVFLIGELDEFLNFILEQRN
jgi:hypothetical protein